MTAGSASAASSSATSRRVPKSSLSCRTVCFASETVMAPRIGSRAEDDGYLITFTVDLNQDRSERIWREIAAGAVPVTSAAPVLRRSLRRNIDLARRFKGNDEGLEEIARFCGLTEREFAAEGLDTRLSPDSVVLSEARLARLALARALALGATELAINAPVLLIEPEAELCCEICPSASKSMQKWLPATAIKSRALTLALASASFESPRRSIHRH